MKPSCRGPIRRWIVSPLLWLPALAILAVAVFDVLQRQRAILRNFPVLGHLRGLARFTPASVAPIATGDGVERPFDRQQTAWIEAAGRQQTSYIGSGSARIPGSSVHIVVKPATFPPQSPVQGEPGFDPAFAIACDKVLDPAGTIPHPDDRVPLEASVAPRPSPLPFPQS